MRWVPFVLVVLAKNLVTAGLFVAAGLAISATPGWWAIPVAVVAIAMSFWLGRTLHKQTYLRVVPRFMKVQ
jgi:hypothetical protein